MPLFWPHNRPFGSASKNGVTPHNTNNRISINLFCFKTLRIKDKKSNNSEVFLRYMRNMVQSVFLDCCFF